LEQRGGVEGGDGGDGGGEGGEGGEGGGGGGEGGDGNSGGDEGGGMSTGLGPQSEQSDPYSHKYNWAPEPPSSQKPSSA